MWRSAVALTMLVVLSGCAGSANAPEAEPSATATSPPKGEPGAPCQGTQLPAAVLSFGGQEQANARISTNWSTDDCGVSAHPFFTIPLPERSLKVPLGDRPQLTFSIKPLSVSGSAWQPDFASAEEPDSDKVQVPIDELRTSTRVDIALEPASSQQVDLSKLAAGEYAIEISAEWDDGRSGWAFHVEILGP